MRDAADALAIDGFVVVRGYAGRPATDFVARMKPGTD